ncbi:MAG: PAS domain S-box protein [Polyangia bacterium]
MASEELLLVHSVLDQAMTTTAGAIHQAAQAERVASEERYRLLVDSAKDYAIFLLDAEGRVANWSGSAQWLKGYAAAEILGHPFQIFFTPEEQAAGAPEQALRTALGEGRFTGRLVFLRKGGARFWAELMLTPLSDASGRLRGYSCITRDVTEQVVAAAERARLLESERAARQEAERSEYKFRRLADSGILGIIISTGSDAILEANDEFLRMVGYSRDDLAHGRLRWLAMTPPEHLPLDEQALHELRTSGSARPYEKEYVCKDGGRVAVALGVATLSQPEDTYIAYVLDITARKVRRPRSARSRSSAMRRWRSWTPSWPLRPWASR